VLDAADDILAFSALPVEHWPKDTGNLSPVTDNQDDTLFAQFSNIGFTSPALFAASGEGGSRTTLGFVKPQPEPCRILNGSR
jgi:hypothetical protein